MQALEINHSNYEGRSMDEHRTYSFLRALNEINEKENKTAVDLGCGHCKFTDIASVYFDRVFAVDARTERVPETLPKNVSFVKHNAVDHNLELYDVVICLGLLYHLTASEQITILKKALGKELIIDTHMATIGHTVISEGYEGVFYKEGDSMEEMMKNPKASTTTLKSFWFYEDEFYRMLREVGYTRIIKFTPEHFTGRTFMYIR